MEVQVAERFEQLPLSALRESARNTRRTYNEARLAELTASIREKGIISPLIARPAPGEPGAYEIAAGHRRFRGAKLAELASAPVIIREYSDDAFQEVLTIENLQREDVHPMEEAEGYAELLKRPGYDVNILAQKVGKSDTYIYQRLKLLDLIPDLQTAFAADKIHIGHAILLARLQPVTQKSMAADLDDSAGGVISVSSLKNEIERRVYLDLNKASFPIGDSQLLSKAGSCHECTKRSGANPALFPEVKAKDMCLDRACFYQKQNAHASAQSAKLTKELGERPLWISTASQYNSEKKKDVLHADAWRTVRKNAPCDSAKKAVVVEIARWSDEKLQVGDVIQVCIDKKCKNHWAGSSLNGPGPRSERTAAELKSELRIKEKAETEAAVEQARIAAAVEAAFYPLEPNIFKELAVVMWKRLWHDHRVKVLARRGLKQQSSRDHNTKDVMLEELDKFDPEQLAGLVIEIAIMESGSRREDQGPDILELALAGISKPVLEQIETTTRAEVKARYEEKYARIDKAAEKKAASAKAAKATAKSATKGEPAAKQATPAKKGKGRKS